MRIGELFAGYGGLGAGVTDVLGGEVAWVSDIDKGANKILAHRFPDVPNLGDITTIDWSAVEPVDVLTGGFPCQDVSTAGRRAGIRPGTRSGLWAHFAHAINELRPRMVVIENVRGLLSAKAHSDVEPCPFCVGDDTDGSLRALGAVLGDLAGLGYDASWHGLRAADVGAPHGRFRVFIVAYPSSLRRGARRASVTGEAEGGRPPADAAGRGDDALRVLPTPTSRDWKDHTIRREPHRPDDVDTLARALTEVPCAGASLAIEAQRLLPTPRATDGEKGGPNQRGSSGDLMLPAAVQPERLLPTPRVTQAGYADDGRGGKSLDVEARRLAEVELCKCGLDDDPEWPLPADMRGNHDPDCPAQTTQRLLPPPMVGSSSLAAHGQISGQWRDQMAEALTRWGDYAAAIARWEHVLGRPAPPPTMTSTKGNPQLSPAFVEWMMGLPAGWVTDVPGITRNEALKALGNGVVSQQCAAALRLMLGQAVAA